MGFLSKQGVKFGIIIGLCVTMAFTVMADTSSDLAEERQNKDELENQLTDVESMLAELEVLKTNTEAYVTELDSQVAAIQATIDNYAADIYTKQQQINDLNAKIAQSEADLEEAYAAMKLRIRFMYENGSNQMVDALLGSESFGEMINKYEYLRQLTSYDRQQMEDIEATINGIVASKSEIETEQAQVVALQENTKYEQNAIVTLLGEKEAELANYAAEIDSAEAAEAALEAEIAASQEAINQLVAKYQAEQAAQQENGGGDNPGGGYTGGKLMMPLDSYTYISTYYGWREWDQSFHSGMDFAAPMGTPIKAAASGMVVSSYLSDSAGEFIILYHGNGLYTEYMHCSVRYAQAGEVVNAGDVIGLVGSTGYSTGPHLHFGVVESDNGYTSAGRVDPAPYIGL